jgi:hypothetical protein
MLQFFSGRIWKFAVTSGVGAAVPLPGLSFVVDLAFLTKEVNFYKSKLDLDENSYEFRKMSPENQEKMRTLCFTISAQDPNVLRFCVLSSIVEESARYIPLLGSVIAGSISFSSTYYFLNHYLNEMERAALESPDTMRTTASSGQPLIFSSLAKNILLPPLTKESNSKL